MAAIRSFFDTEIKRLQSKYNSAFGGVVICNLRQRQHILFAIISLSLMAKELCSEQKRSRKKVAEFMKRKALVSDLLESAKTDGCQHQTDKRRVRK